VADSSRASEQEPGANPSSGGGPAPDGAVEADAPGKFDGDTAVRREGEEGSTSIFSAEVSADWRAGRGPHGGYLAAMILRALIETVDAPERAPRSLTIHYTRAPEPGPVSIRTVRERDGRSLSSLSARMEQDGRLIALVLAAFSVPWSGPEIDDLPAPSVDPPSQPVWPGRRPDPRLPPIARHTVLQRRFGGRPLSGEEQPMEVGGWLGHRERREIDALSLAFFSDALIPAPFMRFEAPKPAPTIDLNVHFRAALPLPGPDLLELCLIQVRTGLIHEGFFEEDSLMWAPDGTLLAQSRQLALLIPGSRP
jgi:acyl-CoA thioesterase